MSRHWVAALMSAACVAGCGGGGGDEGGAAAATVQVPEGARAGTASADSDVNATNYSAFGGPAGRAALTGSSGDAAGALHSERESALSRNIAAPSGRDVADWVSAAAALATPSPGQRERALATQSETMTCPYGGTMTITIDDADGSGRVSAGDHVSLSFSACRSDAASPAVNGTLSMRFNAVELNAAEELVAFDATVTLGQLSGFSAGSMSGSMRLWKKPSSAGSYRLRVSYQGVTVTEGSTTVRYDFDRYGTYTDSGNASYQLSGELRIEGRTFSVDSGTFTATAGQAPSSGWLRLRDASGDAVTLRARSSTSVDVEFQPAGATAPTATQARTWSSIRSGG